MQETHPDPSVDVSTNPDQASGTPLTDALLSKWDDDGASRGAAFGELAALSRQLEESVAQRPSAPLRLTGYQLKQALALAWPDGDCDPQQAESVVFLERLQPDQANHADTGEGNPPGLYLSFEDAAGDEGLYLLDETDEDAAARAEAERNAPRQLDNCQVCRGARGGVLGNENVIAGVIVCDYCHADDSYLPKTLEMAQLLGATGAPHNEQERLRFEAYMRGHCWKVGEWNAEKCCYEDMTCRMLFAVWRDRASMRG